MGFAQEPKHKSNLYPLVCTIVCGDVSKQDFISGARTVDEFLALNSHVSSQRVTLPIREVHRSDLRNDFDR